LPRLSRISRPRISIMAVIALPQESALLMRTSPAAKAAPLPG
jgi:hypothetical protein